jgi:hypothetical protein
MEDSAYLTQLLAGLFYTAASVALFRLCARTGHRPERLLVLIPMSALGRIATACGVIAAAVFTRLVFRSDAAWADWMVRGSATLIAAGVPSPPPRRIGAG